MILVAVLWMGQHATGSESCSDILVLGLRVKLWILYHDLQMYLSQWYYGFVTKANGNSAYVCMNHHTLEKTTFPCFTRIIQTTEVKLSRELPAPAHLSAGENNCELKWTLMIALCIQSAFPFSRAINMSRDDMPKGCSALCQGYLFRATLLLLKGGCFSWRVQHFHQRRRSVGVLMACKNQLTTQLNFFLSSLTA